MKHKLLLFISLLILVPAASDALTIKATKEQLREIIFEKTFPAAVFEGKVSITSQTGFINYPTRFVVGIFEGSPKEHSFRVVLEQIEESKDSYWLLYEYVKNHKEVFRLELNSEIKLNEIVEFSIFWVDTNRLQVTVNGVSHYPYVSLKSKTPFMSIRVGEADIDYDYKAINLSTRKLLEE